MSIFVRNWRDQEPYVGHISALVWTLYQSHDKDETSPPDVNRLHGINSFVKHGLQGHQHSDHHQHDSIEQLYFILRGRGQLTIGDDKVDVRDGTAVYMPVNVPHQAFNDGDGWMEHLIVSCPLDEIREGTPAVRDWRDVHPVVLEGGTISWPLLLREGEVPAGEGGVLQRVHGVTRYAVQGRQGTAWRQLDGIELVHYVLSGYGTIEDLDGNRQLVTEGCAVHVLPGVAHRFANQAEGWLEYVTFAVEVGEVEMPLESDEDADAVEADGQYGVEEAVAAAVVAEAEVGLDDADAVEAEDEEIEDAATVDVVGEDEEAATADVVGEDEEEVTADADAMDEEEDEDAAESGVLEEDVDVETDEEVDDSGGIESEVEEAEEEVGNGDEGEAEVAGAEEGIATAEEEIVAEEEQEVGGDAEVDDDEELGGEAEVDDDEEASEEGYEAGKDDAEEDQEGVDEEDDGGDVEDEQITGEVEDVGEVVEDTDAGEEIETDEEAEEEEESEVEDLDEDLDGDEEEEDDAADADEDGVDDEGELDQGAAGPADAEDESSAEDDDFDLEDDDADFDIEDDDEPAVEDETGEEDDDSPDADRR